MDQDAAPSAARGRNTARRQAAPDRYAAGAETTVTTGQPPAVPRLCYLAFNERPLPLL